MAKTRGKAKHGSHRKHTRRANPSHRRHPHRRRRNPSGDFGSRLGRFALAGAGAIATAVAVTYATGKISPGATWSLYGIPAVAFLGGVAIARKMPMTGVSIALGSVAPFALPLASKLLSAGQSSGPQQTAAGLGRAYRTLHPAMGWSRQGTVYSGAQMRGRMAAVY